MLAGKAPQVGKALRAWLYVAVKTATHKDFAVEHNC